MSSEKTAVEIKFVSFSPDLSRALYLSVVCMCVLKLPFSRALSLSLPFTHSFSLSHSFLPLK